MSLIVTPRQTSWSVAMKCVWTALVLLTIPGDIILPTDSVVKGMLRESWHLHRSERVRGSERQATFFFLTLTRAPGYGEVLGLHPVLRGKNEFIYEVKFCTSALIKPKTCIYHVHIYIPAHNFRVCFVAAWDELLFLVDYDVHLHRKRHFCGENIMLLSYWTARAMRIYLHPTFLF